MRTLEITTYQRQIEKQKKKILENYCYKSKKMNNSINVFEDLENFCLSK